MSERYSGYSRLKFDRPHPKVLRITMDNGKFNTADRVMHAELARIWRDVDADPAINTAIITGARHDVFRRRRLRDDPGYHG